jgi:hypothetical protein
LPIVLDPWFLLEPQRQSYPPLFAVLLALIPDYVVKRYHWVLNHLFDAVTFGVWALVLDATGTTLFVAGLIYATSPYLILEFTALTSRSLALLLMTLWVGVLTLDGELNPLVLTVIGGVVVFLILMCHKLTVQLAVPTSILLSIVTGNLSFVVSVLVGYMFAVIFTRDLLYSILRAHMEILKFWTRNWKNLGAHQVRDSPIYGSGAHSRPFHRRGVSGLAVHLVRVAQMNPWVLVLLFAYPQVSVVLGANSDAIVLYCVVVLGASLLTLLVGALRPFGEGTKYIKYAVAPSVLIVVSVVDGPSDDLARLLFVGALIIHLLSMARVARIILLHRSSTDARLDQMRTLLPYLKCVKRARVMCLPTNLADAFVYETRSDVLWGTHHEGFGNVEPFFPVLRHPVSFFVDRYQLNFILIDVSYVKPEEVGLVKRNLDAVAGTLHLYRC